MALFPRYVNIRRGQLIWGIFSRALVPCRILKSAGNFLNFIAAYAVFLNPIAAILLTDFWVVHSRKYNVLNLYNPDGIYHYWKGMNWRAIVAFIIGVALSMVGFINSVNHNIDVGVGVHPFQFGWLLGFVSTGVICVLLSRLFPQRETFIDKALLPDEVYDARDDLVDGVPYDDDILAHHGQEEMGP
jgi:NCS1 family nucleobase:cation symporter-1